jgi:hypothetical protein
LELAIIGVGHDGECSRRCREIPGCDRITWDVTDGQRR